MNKFDDIFKVRRVYCSYIYYKKWIEPNIESIKKQAEPFKCFISGFFIDHYDVIIYNDNIITNIYIKSMLDIMGYKYE